MKKITTIFLFNRNCPYFSDIHVAEMSLDLCNSYAASNKFKHDVIHFETEEDYIKNVEEIGGYDPREWIFKFFYEVEKQNVMSDSAFQSLGNCGYRIIVISYLKKANYVVKNHSFYLDINSNSTFTLSVDREIYKNNLSKGEILRELFIVVGDMILNSLNINL